MKQLCIALGFFDGLHLGHDALLKKTIERARELDLTPAVLTFDQHPKTVLTGKPTPLIYTPEKRAQLLHDLYGIDTLCTCHVDMEFLNMSPEAFVQDVLLKQYHAAYVIAGEDFHYGRKNEGTPETLQKTCNALGIGVDILPCVTLDGIVVSSSYIRSLIQDGNIAEGEHFLGHSL